MDKLLPVGFYDATGKSLLGQLDMQDAISADPHPDEEKIIGYLNQGLGIVGCGGVIRDCLNPDLPVRLGKDVFSDGVWEWPDYLSYYVGKYHLRLPGRFVAHMANNNWMIHPFSVSEAYRRIVIY